ncbi:heterokaryon incompatibility domain-containing protein [Trichoderma velutinum]
MRLLHASKWHMADFISDDAIPRYAILSHTWGGDEVTYHDWRTLSISEAKLKAGCAKILACRGQAVRDGLEWVWVDTCCIDKSSSAELTEAINSMFRWYTNAAVCYVLLADVEATSDQAVLEERMAKSRWFTRGWTLQELLAPPPEKLIFYSSEWARLGSKTDFVDIVSSITRINKPYLQGQDLRHASVAQKMSWAALRQTSRLEDVAYCLLGLFDINMPMIYGEGDRAFIRLQEAIMTSTPDDHSLFAWGPILDETDIASKIANYSQILLKEPPRPDSATCELELFGLLAASPKDFEHSGNIIVSREAARFYKSPDNPNVPTKIGRDAFRLDLPMWDQKVHALYHWKEPNIAQSRVLDYAALLCHFEDDPSSSSCVILPLISNGGWTVSRPRTLCYRRGRGIIFASVSKKKTISIAPEMQIQFRAGDVIFRRMICGSPIQTVGYEMAADTWYDLDGAIGYLSSSSFQHRYGRLLTLNYKKSDQDERGISIVFHRLAVDDQIFIQVIPVNFAGKEQVQSDDITWYQSTALTQATPMFTHSMALPSDEWHVERSPMPDVYLRAERVAIDGSGLFVDVMDLLVGFELGSS